MGILNFSLQSVGQTGQDPSIIYFNTDNTVAEVTTAGYLNKFVAQGNIILDSQVAVVATRTTPNARVSSANYYTISFSGGNWTLTAGGGGSIPSGEEGQMLNFDEDGNLQAITISQDINIATDGAATIQDEVIVDSMIAEDANINVSKLLPGEAGQIPVTMTGEGGNTVANQTVGGDAGLAGDGTLTLNPEIYKRSSILLSSGDINGMFSSPVEVLPELEAGQLYANVRVLSKLNYNTTPYEDGGPVYFIYGNAQLPESSALTTSQPAANIYSNQSVFMSFLPLDEWIQGTADSAGLSLSITCDTQDFTAGDSSINLDIEYCIKNT